MSIKGAFNAVRQAVLERDGYRCTKCGMTEEEHKAKYGRGLHTHRTTPGSKYTLEGCITLCHKCHARWHEDNPDAERSDDPDSYEPLVVSVPPDLKEWLREAARHRGETMGSYIRHLLLTLQEKESTRNVRD